MFKLPESLISVLCKIVVDLNVDSKFIIKIGQKLHGHAYTAKKISYP